MVRNGDPWHIEVVHDFHLLPPNLRYSLLKQIQRRRLIAVQVRDSEDLELLASDVRPVVSLIVRQLEGQLDCVTDANREVRVDRHLAEVVRLDGVELLRDHVRLLVGLHV